MSPPGQCPYLALRYFEERDSHLFYGRDGHVRELLSKLELNRFVAVLGSSGCGKSSLVRAGLLPELKSGMIPAAGYRWNVIEFKPGSSPMEELGGALERGLGIQHATETIAEGPLGIARAVDSASLEAGTNVLIIADQFEEIFAYIREEQAAGRGTEAREQAQALVRRLLDAAAEPNLRIYVLLVMRSDYLGDCAQFPDLPERMNASLYLVPRLRRDQLQRAIEAPVGRDIEPAVVQRLLGEVGADPDQLPRLQHLLSRMWIAAGGGRITLAHYTAAGGWKNALEQHLDQIYEDLTPSQQKACRLVFQRVSEIDRGRAVRRWATREQLRALCGPGAEDAADEVVDIFHREGFLRLSGLHQDIVDVMHESVLRGWPRLAGRMEPRLVGWMEEENRSERRLHELAAASQEAGWRPGMSAAEKNKVQGISGLTLTNLISWRNEFQPTGVWASRYLDAGEFEAAIDFLNWCEAREREREKTARAARLRARTLLAAIPLLVALAVATGGFYWKGNQAMHERDRAQQSSMLASHEKQEADRERLAAENSAALASKEKQEAEGQRQKAEAVATFAETEKGLAEEAAKHELTLLREAKSRELAADSVEQQTQNPERSILLAMQAVNVTAAFGLPLLPAATTALHSAILSSQVRSTLRGHTNAVASVAFSPDGRRVATGSTDNTAKIWDAQTGEELMTLRGHAGVIWSIAFSPDGRRLATGSTDKTAKIWDAQTGMELMTLNGHADIIMSIAFSPDGRRLATASEDKTAKIWDAQTGKELMTLSEPEGWVLSVAFSPDGKHLATANFDGTAKIWDAETGKELMTLHGHESALFSVAFSPDGKRLATASFDETARIWDADTGKELMTLRGHFEVVRSVAFSPDGKRVATASHDETAKIWDAQTGKELTTLRGHEEYVNGVAFSPDGRRLATAGGDGTAKIWDTEPGKELMTLRGHTNTVFSIAFSPDGRSMATGSTDNTAKIWDAETGRELRTLSGHTDGVLSIAYSPDGRRLATGSRDKTARIWDAETGKELMILRGHEGWVYSVAFSPDGKRLATSSTDKTAKIWDAEAGKELMTMSGHTDVIGSVTFSPDGKRLATASDDKTARIWDAETGKVLMVLPGHEGLVNFVVFSPDGTRLATASDDRTAKIWDAGTGKELMTLRGHEDKVETVAFSPDGKHLATGSLDKTAKIWDVQTGQELATLHGHEGGVLPVAFSPDSRRLATGSSDKTVQVYAVDLRDLLALARSRVTRDLTAEECKQYFDSSTCPRLP